jgi:hypothetical protein
MQFTLNGEAFFADIVIDDLRILNDLSINLPKLHEEEELIKFKNFKPE